MPVIRFTLTDEQYAVLPHARVSSNEFIKTHVIETLNLGGSSSQSKHAKRTSKETQEAILAAHADGLSIDYISKKYSLSRPGVYKILQRNNRPAVRRALSSADRMAIYQSHCDGEVVGTLMVMYGISGTTIRNVIKSFDPIAFKSDSRNSEIIKARQLGATVKELVEQFKISESQIRNILRSE